MTSSVLLKTSKLFIDYFKQKTPRYNNGEFLYYISLSVKRHLQSNSRRDFPIHFIRFSPLSIFTPATYYIGLQSPLASREDYGGERAPTSRWLAAPPAITYSLNCDWHRKDHREMAK